LVDRKDMDAIVSLQGRVEELAEVARVREEPCESAMYELEAARILLGVGCRDALRAAN
jgi:hypothetical protein